MHIWEQITIENYLQAIEYIAETENLETIEDVDALIIESEAHLSKLFDDYVFIETDPGDIPLGGRDILEEFGKFSLDLVLEKRMHQEQYLNYGYVGSYK